MTTFAAAWRRLVPAALLASIATAAAIAGPVAAANARPFGPGPDDRLCQFRGNEYYDGTSVVIAGKVYECRALSSGAGWVFQYDTGRR
jgi:hypothetical protein